MGVPGNSINSGLAAELTALHFGLKLIVQMHISPVCIEMDAQNVIDSIQEANSDHYLSSIIIQCRDLIRQLGAPPISHVMKECNKCADIISRDALLLVLPFFHYVSMPLCINSQFLADKEGITYPRTLY
ncbi:uncharacterized protein LOC131321310 [Rhododendron vialii]|uniref:uncharacterized protein LOC131321310 n=1 Tax=Rhododendron vialii TaxID=182163 RepID=UPI00265E2DEE|nr:uncharacterized protein LOC131321310 [Rhododendron vialii]